ncbi:transposable element Tc1 transposase [Trichonephila clavipes]|nr:transposable element Tc1 transposase [Trichonephila clavipes]
MKSKAKCWQYSQVGNCLATYISRAVLKLWESLDLRFYGIILSGYFFYTSNKYSGRGSQVLKVSYRGWRCRAQPDHRDEKVDRSESAVRNCWEQWTREGTHAWKTGFGVTRTTTRRKDRRIVRLALVDPTVTRSTIRADVGVAIVPQTISRHFAEANLKSKHPFRALPLTPDHWKLRLQWCQARSMWNVTDWQKVVFSDESRFVLGTDDNRVRVWRCPGEWYNPPHTVLRHTAHTAGVMVWGP